MTADRLGIVVVNYGSSALLEQTLVPLDLTGAPVTVVVVDNFSSAGERAATAALAAAHGWSFVGLPDNRGFGAGVNAGIRAARAAGCVCFLLLNPDASVTREVVEELRRHVLAEPLSLVAPRVVAPDGTVFFAGSRLLLDSGRIRGGRPDPAAAGREVAWMTGACLALHEDLLSRTGELDESYFLYWEDVEFSHRARTAGARLVVREDLVAVHDAGGTQGPTRGRAKSALYYRSNCENRLRFAAAHLPRRQLLRWLLVTPAVSWEILLRGGRRQLVHQPGLALAAARGSAAGLALAVAALVRRRRPAQPRRVLVAHPGAELYGSDRMLAESVAGLVEQGDEVVVALPTDGPLVAELEQRGARVVLCPMPVLRKSALTPRGLAGLVRDGLRGLWPAWRLVRRSGTAGVYVSTVTIPSWSVIGRLAGRRVTLHVHEAESAAPRVLRRVLAAPAALASEVLVNSRYSRDVLAGSAARVAARAVVVLNGVTGPAEVVPPRPRIEGPVRLAYVGRLSPRKGPQVAVDTLAELVGRGLDARLDLAGAVYPGYEWFETDLRQQVARAGLADRVSFLGFVTDVWGVLAAADVVLIPSVLDEPFGNTAVEAVLASRPVVVSATSGLREAAAGYASARVVPPGDVAEWADAVHRVVQDWDTVAAGTAADAAEARRRHAPARYRAEVARLVSSPDTRGRA